MHIRCMLSCDSVALQVGVRMDQIQHANVRRPMLKLWNTTVTRAFSLRDTTPCRSINSGDVSEQPAAPYYECRAASFSETSAKRLSINRTSYPRIKPYINIAVEI